MKTPAKMAEGQHEQGCEKQIFVAAFENDQLSDKAAQQLIALEQDGNRKTYRGKDLPSVSTIDLLNQIAKEAE